MTEGIISALVGAVGAIAAAILTSIIQPWVKEKLKGNLKVLVTHEHFGIPDALLHELTQQQRSSVRVSEEFRLLVNAKGRTKITIRNESSHAIEGVTVRITDVGPVVAEFLDNGEKVVTSSGNTFRLGSLYPASRFSLEVYTPTCFAELDYDDAVGKISVTARVVGKISIEHVLWGYLRQKSRIEQADKWRLVIDFRVIFGIFIGLVIIARVYQAVTGEPLLDLLGPSDIAEIRK